eukprot:TRINITY_DN614_c0_g1_i3.p1 TRINITY_DN614_c0_g1~~TRINITY_DN614_c0_g1_i3.p1  ORF type:complete len:122 (-),score=5.61 TRINITY_DN614_c0_g1_i3:14-379(-)
MLLVIQIMLLMFRRNPNMLQARAKQEICFRLHMNNEWLREIQTLRRVHQDQPVMPHCVKIANLNLCANTFYVLSARIVVNRVSVTFKLTAGHVLENLTDVLVEDLSPVSYTHLTLPTICSV